MLKIDFSVKPLGFGVSEITAPMGEKIYLIEGNLRALVIDTGMGIGSLLGVIRSFCQLPLVVVNTHGHPDHTGGNAEFKKVYLHTADFALYYMTAVKRYRIADIRKIFGDEGKIFEDNLIESSTNVVPLLESEEFDLGGRRITAHRLEGHTKGSVALHDSLTNWLFTGDAVSLKDTWLFLDCSTSLAHYRNSLLGFILKNIPVTKILSGHEPNVATPELLNIKLECLNKIIFGELKGEEVTTFAGSGRRVEYKGTSIIYNPKRIRDDKIQ
ncbi:MAG: MBL fold metallo-hydrolase [Candidatus Coproplasma sp.]